MVPDGQKMRTGGMDGRTEDAKTISLRFRRGIITLVALIFFMVDILEKNKQLSIKSNNLSQNNGLQKPVPH